PQSARRIVRREISPSLYKGVPKATTDALAMTVLSRSKKAASIPGECKGPARNVRYARWPRKRVIPRRTRTFGGCPSCRWYEPDPSLRWTQTFMTATLNMPINPDNPAVRLIRRSKWARRGLTFVTIALLVGAVGLLGYPFYTNF